METTVDAGLIVAMVSLAFAGLGLLWQHYTVISKIQQRLSSIETVTQEMKNLPGRVVALETKMGLFWRTVEETMPQHLISPHSPNRDELLRKFSSRNITQPEAEELLKDLECNLEEFKGDKFLAASFAIMGLRNWLIERGDRHHATH